MSTRPRPVLMVVLGAGASHDALLVDRDYTAQVPLTDDLLNFEQMPYLPILGKYEGAAPTAQVVREGMYRDGRRVRSLETVMRSLVADSARRPMTRQHLLAFKYYLRDVIWGASRRTLETDGRQTNFVRLGYELERLRERVDGRLMYVTFNYDLLLEDALGDVTGTPFRTLDRYITDDLSVIKPHGSVNWGERVTGHDRLAYVSDPNDMVRLGATLAGTGIYDLITDPSEMRRVSGGEFVPALAVPTTGKAAFVMPDDHRERLLEWLPDVRYVLTIGWKGGEGQFLGTLAKFPSSAPLEVVTRSEASARRVARRLDRTLFTSLARPWGIGFKAFARGDELKSLSQRIRSSLRSVHPH